MIRPSDLILLILTVGAIQIQAQTFVESSSAAGIDHLHVDEQLMGGGTAFFDYNNDGFDDLYLTGGNGRDLLYENNQDGTFTEVGVAAGLSFTANHNTVGVATGDIDNDGDRDVFVTTDKFSANILLLNNGDNTFTDISTSAGITDTAWSTSVTFGDYNLDGFSDIYVANYVDFNYSPNAHFYDSITGFVGNYLYVNNGDNTFTENASLLGVADTNASLAVTFTDFDNDNDVDIIIGNDFGFNLLGLHNKVFENLYPLDSFADISQIANADDAIDAMSVAIGDYNEDGHLDYYISNMMENLLKKNNGNKTFTNTATALGIEAPSVTSWGGFFFDYDNNTSLDLFVASGQMMFEEPNQYQYNNLFQNNSGVFSDVALTEGVLDSTRSRGAAYSDFDNDGDLDFVLVNANSDSNTVYRTMFFKNQSSNTNNWLEVKLTGTQNNRDAFGSHVKIISGGQSFIREIDGGSGYLSHNSTRAHFGLGTISTIDTLLVYWGGGAVQMELNVATNQIIEVIENTTTQQHVCFGDSILVGNVYYHESGTYYDTLTANSGADSIINVVVEVSDSIYIQNLSICPNDSVEVGGVYYTTPTTLQDTLVSFFGCDSVVKSILTAGRKDTVIITVPICQGDSLFLQGAYQTTEDYYVDVLVNNTNCDSLVVTHLVVNPIYSDTVDYYLCAGDSVYVGGMYQIAGGYYSDYYTSSFGCDSTIVTNVMNMPNFFTTSAFICQGDSMLLEGAYQTTSGNYYDTLVSSVGCDSVVLTQLTVTSSYNGSVFTTICQGDSILLEGTYQFTAGIYHDNYVGVGGCDSTITTYLSILPTYSATETVTICQGDSIQIGNNYQSTAGTYSVTYSAINGCDSIIETTLVVNPSELIHVDTTIYLGDSIFLQGGYQSTQGTYYDTLTNQYNCDSIIETAVTIDSSVNVLSLYDDVNVRIYPNPLTDYLKIESPKEIQEVWVTNSIGAIVYRKTNLNKTQVSINLQDLPKGAYFVSVSVGENKSTSLVVKK